LRRRTAPLARTEKAIALNGRSRLPVSEAIPADGVAPKPAIASNVGDHIDLPIGIGAIFLILLSTAIVNLFTKKVATIWGIGFTIAFLVVFIICEQLSHRLRRGGHHEHLEQFNEKVTDQATPQSLGLTHAQPVLVAIRNPRSMRVLDRVLDETDTTRHDIVAITCKVLPPMTPGITPQELTVNDNDREVLTRVVNLAEQAGKQVYPLVIPTNNPLYAIAIAARDLDAKELVMGTSEKSDVDVQLEHFAIAWGMATSEAPARALTIRIIGADDEVKFEL
jgi:nucleotide-binding universal stress UspA family protein